MSTEDEHSIPRKMREKYEAVTAITDGFCREHLNEEYAGLEAVMNSIKNGLGMRETENHRRLGQPENPHSNGVFTQVHNTL